MNILLMNCYSSKNSGDGLLVDLAVKEIKREHGEDVDITLVCSDPDSFKDNYKAVENEYSANSSWINILFIFSKSMLYLLTGRYNSKRYKVFCDFDAVYSVGGGYLRFGSIIESIKTITVHCSQIFWASANFKGKHILLSQSIGPFRFISKSFIQKLLANKSQIFVRDDLSFKQLEDMSILSSRKKDMAVEKLIEDLNQIKSSFQKEVVLSKKKVCIFILRDLRRGNKVNQAMLDKISKLSTQFDDVIYAVQSEVNSNNDADFYSQYNLNAKLSVKKALKKYPNAIVISIRLHGAIESLLAGMKTIHLTYERKGFGAYQDLNIPQFVHNVYSFDVTNVEKNIEELSSIKQLDFFNLVTDE